jgi:hypothetical protein
MSSQLTPDKLFTYSQQYRDIAILLIKIIGKLQFELQQLQNSGASIANIDKKQGEIQETNSRITKVITIANELNTQAIRDILVSTDVENAMDAINKASEQVIEAVDEINSIRKTLEYIDLFIRVGGAIVNAAITGTPAAQIKAIIGAIDKLYQTDFTLKKKTKNNN